MIHAEWSFPLTKGGQRRGIADPGIVTFKGNEIENLAREVCQNSLDARQQNNNEPVVVEFQKYSITQRQFPGYQQYKECIANALLYYTNDFNNSEKGYEFLEKAHTAINQESISVLRISDYNTIGLANPYKYATDGWNALTKIDGGSTKSGDSAGSYGIGKNAPFCTSDYRVVFYRTLNIANEKAAQGLSRFLSFPMDMHNTEESMTTGIGYYGNADKYNPIEHIEYLDNLNKRHEIGTDIFIYGFNYNQNWKDLLIFSILDNFLVSIFRKQLVVKVDNEIIKHNTLHKYIKNDLKEYKNIRDYYNVLISKDTILREIDFMESKLLLKVLTYTGNDTMNRKIMITRKSGMKLFDMDRLPSGIYFSSVLEINGDKANSFFREIERPDHKKWDPKLHSQPTFASKQVSELTKLLKSTIIEICTPSTDDKISVGGLSSKLALQANVSNLYDELSKITGQDFKESVGKISIVKKRRPKDTTKAILHNAQEDDAGITLNKLSLFEEEDLEPTFATLPENTTSSSNSSSSSPNSVTTDIDKSKADTKEQGKLILLKKLRLIKTDSRYYSLIFMLPKNIYRGKIRIKAVGENGNIINIKLNEAGSYNAIDNIILKDNNIYFYNLLKYDKHRIYFSTDEDYDFAMEVDIYEYK